MKRRIMVLMKQKKGERIKRRKINYKNMKRRIMVLMKQKNNYHSKDSTRRNKKDRRSGENPT
jgi:hypothetical protein